jgi:glycosyltransferase involved in cell wall biosynthesis
MADVLTRRFLLLAQLPPPVHGVTVMTQRVRDLVADDGRWAIEHRWLGGSKSLQDVNRRTAKKYLEFAGLLLGLVIRRATGPRADVAYTTLAPWTHAALRDGLLAGAAKGISARTLVHLHGEGLDRLLEGGSLKSRLSRWMLKGTELIACTSGAAHLAERSGLFARVTLLPNSVPDPGHSHRPPAGGKIRIGYLANLDPRKGVLRFVDALAAAHCAGVPFEAVIAGPATPFLSKNDVLARIDGLGLGGVVAVEDGKYGAEKDNFFRGLDILLYPSLHDHAPLVVIEALSHGVVPVVIDTGGIQEILGGGLSRNVFHAQSGDEPFETFVTRTIERYACDPSQLAADRAKARARYLEMYTEADFVRRCRAILEAPPVPVPATETLGHLVS